MCPEIEWGGVVGAQVAPEAVQSHTGGNQGITVPGALDHSQWERWSSARWLDHRLDGWAYGCRVTIVTAV